MSKKIKLNIACGPNIFPHPGWINYDREDFSSYFNAIKTHNQTGMPEHQKKLSNYVRSGEKIDFIIHDIRNGFPQHETNSVNIIYCGQMIEHFNPVYEVPKFLSECYRILVPGGLIRLTTPDLDLLIQSYLNGQMDKFSIEQPAFYKNEDPSTQLSFLMYGACGPNCTWDNYEGHMFLFTKKSMTNMLQKNGFKEIEFYYETGKSKDIVMAKEAVDAGMTHSFVVEAIKQ